MAFSKKGKILLHMLALRQVCVRHQTSWLGVSRTVFCQYNVCERQGGKSWRWMKDGIIPTVSVTTRSRRFADRQPAVLISVCDTRTPQSSQLRSFSCDTAKDNPEEHKVSELQVLEVGHCQNDVEHNDLGEKHFDALTSEVVSTEGETFEDIQAKKPVVPSYNLAVYVAQSEVLQRLVGLGVDLSAVEKIPEAADHLVQSNWDGDIQPKLLFLQDIGVHDGDMGKVLTKNPLLLKEDLDDLQVRVDYFSSKKFKNEDIGHIVTKAPITLLMPVTLIDKKLGFLQRTYSLSGDEVRAVVIKLPKMISWKLQKLKDTRFYMKEMLGFSDAELRTMLLSFPKLYITDKHQLGKRFDFLYNVMGMSHKDLVLWPAVMRTRLHVLQQRHRFLLSVGRAQYDPTKENYVSLKALVSGKDRDFCFHVAKASTTQFNNFLKAI